MQGKRHLSPDGQGNHLSIKEHAFLIQAPSLDRDVLLVNSQTNLLAYDIEQNTDLFYKEVSHHTAACMSVPRLHVWSVGQLGESEETLAYVEGNCSSHGFDHLGIEHFWTVREEG